MAKDIVSNAVVVIKVNGNDASQQLENLKNKIKQTKDEMNRLRNAGVKDSDPKIQKLQKEYQKLSKELETCSTDAARVASVMERLDKASPKQLMQTVKTLKKQLETMERGTAMWDKQAQKIRQVETQIQKVNAAMRVQESRWSRINRWLNDCQTSLMGFAAVITGMIMAGRKAVNQYAEMEEQMANTMKFTRMTKDQVAELNGIFKGMDTRLAREQLNLLAQEGGRLGYNTVEKVKEYVEAASTINVALVDLGEGATQTIAKLTNIFGIEDVYGTRDSMLKVGSTVNHLSQNCTASKPFIVEFTQRLAGIGTTAKMAIPDIMAFAATLDAHGQKVEMSATAIQRVIVELFKRPAEMAKLVGLNANYFTTILQNDVTAGLIKFLGALNKLGENGALAVLSPLFQDLGLDGQRVTAVLANLSSHLDFLRWQLDEARQAFKDGSSASNEYAIFNNTVQASIDKAKKKVSELGIELGEKLYPIMRHIYTSGSAFLRILNVLVDFFIKHKTAIVALSLALITYNTQLILAKKNIALTTIATKAHTLAVKADAIAMTSAKAIIFMLQGAFYTLIGRIDLAAIRWRALSMVIKASPLGLALAAVSAIGVAIYNMATKADTLSQYVNKLLDTTRSWSKETVAEQRELDVLIGKMKGAEEGSEQYEKAKQSIIDQYGKYLEGIVTEEGKILDLGVAYDRLTKAIQRNALAKGLQAAQDKLNEQYAENLSNNLSALQRQLEFYGMSAVEASELTTRIAGNIMSGSQMNQKDIDKINEISKQKFPGSNAWEKISSFLNASMLTVVGESISDFFGWDIIHTIKAPSDILQEIVYDAGRLKIGNDKIQAMRDGMDPYHKVENKTLELAIEYLKKSIKNAEEEEEAKLNKSLSDQQIIDALTVSTDNVVSMVKMDVFSARKEISKYEEVLGLRGWTVKKHDSSTKDNDDEKEKQSLYPYTSEKERKKEEAEAKRAQIKARKEFKEGLDRIKAEYEKAEYKTLQAYSKGQIQHIQYLNQKMKNSDDFFNKSIQFYHKHFRDIKGLYLKDDKDYQALFEKKSEAHQKFEKQIFEYKKKRIERERKFEEAKAKKEYNRIENPTPKDDNSYRQQLYDIRQKYLWDMKSLYKPGSDEWKEYNEQIKQEGLDFAADYNENYEKRVKEMRKKYSQESAIERAKIEIRILDQLLEAKKISEKEHEEWKAKLIIEYQKDIPGFKPSKKEQNSRLQRQRDKDKEKIDAGVKSGLITKEEGEARKKNVDTEFFKSMTESLKNVDNDWITAIADVADAWYELINCLDMDWSTVMDNIGNVAATTMNAVAMGFQVAAQFAQANAQIEIAAIEKRYDREKELAQGNSYLEAKLEKEKQRKIAAEKNKAAKNAFAMQVIQAVAQTIQGTINAYTSTAAIPAVGPALAPAAAAVAAAAGAVQITLLQKQQQASEAQGYASGGYTSPGRKYEVAGVVHAGEWVASQELLASPVASPLIRMLDHVQKTNTIGSLTPEDVSRSVSIFNGYSAVQGPSPQNVRPGAVVIQGASPSPDGESAGVFETLSLVIDRLNRRLDMPIEAISTVTGPNGSKRAEDEYKRLMRNKNLRK